MILDYPSRAKLALILLVTISLATGVRFVKAVIPGYHAYGERYESVLADCALWKIHKI